MQNKSNFEDIYLVIEKKIKIKKAWITIQRYSNDF